MSSPVNLSNLRNMTGNDAELEKELFEIFLLSAGECIENLRASCQTGSDEAWRKEAHAFKGISLNLGAEKLGELCKEAQNQATAARVEKQRMLVAIETEYANVRQYLMQI